MKVIQADKEKELQVKNTDKPKLNKTSELLAKKVRHIQRSQTPVLERLTTRESSPQNIFFVDTNLSNKILKNHLLKEKIWEKNDFKNEPKNDLKAKSKIEAKNYSKNNLKNKKPLFKFDQSNPSLSFSINRSKGPIDNIDINEISYEKILPLIG